VDPPLRTRHCSSVALALALAGSAAAMSCARQRLGPDGRVIWVSGELRAWADSAPVGAATVTLLGGPDHSQVVALGQTLTGPDGRFDLAIGGAARIECATWQIRIQKIGYPAWESRPGQLRCRPECQWVDLRIARPAISDGIELFDVLPVDCAWKNGYPVRKPAT
jgi:hypothetical protein